MCVCACSTAICTLILMHKFCTSVSTRKMHFNEKLPLTHSISVLLEFQLWIRFNFVSFCLVSFFSLCLSPIAKNISSRTQMHIECNLLNGNTLYVPFNQICMFVRYVFVCVCERVRIYVKNSVFHSPLNHHCSSVLLISLYFLHSFTPIAFAKN